MNYAKHIVFLTPGFASDEADFLCMPYLQDYFRGLQTAQPGLRISVIAFQYPFRTAHYQWHGIDVWALGGRNRRWRKPLTWRRCERLLHQLQRSQAIDVLHAFWVAEASAAALRFGKVQGIPVYATVMGQDALPQNRWLRRLDFDRLQLIGLSDFSAKLFKETTGCAVHVIIPFGIAEHDVAVSVAHDRPIDILGVSSFIGPKRLDRFLRVVNALRATRPGLRALLIGEGPALAAIQKFVADHGLAGHLEILPIVERVQVLDWMRKSKVFLHTSNIEGMGLVLAEALAQGCHLVSTPVGIAEPSDKCLVANNTYRLGECVAHWLDHPVDFRARVPFPLAETVRQHLRLYGFAE